MGLKYTYDVICSILKEKNTLECLIDTNEDFERKRKKTGMGRYIQKILFRCKNCGNVFERNLACVKMCVRPWLCSSCSQSEGAENQRKDYARCKQDIQDKGFTPLFNPEDIHTVHQKVKCVGSCGHDVVTSVHAFLRAKTSLCAECASKIHCGENNYNWKGGYENEKVRFRKTYEFKSFVRAVLKRDNYTCQCCNRNSRQTKLVVHHKDGYNWCIEKRTDVGNGVTLCEDCHKLLHNVYGVGKNTKEQYDEFIKSHYGLIWE